MSKKMLFILLISFSLQGVGQPVKNDFSERAVWLQKSKNQKTAAWLLLSGGTFMALSGYVLFVYEGLQGDGVKSVKAKLDAVIFCGGIAAMVSSITLFTAAARNKKIAMSVTAGIKMENNISPPPPSFAKTSFPSLAIKISL